VNRELEVRIGVRIDAALDRIRSKICSMGMAAKWHIGRASDLLQNPDLLERVVEPLGEQEEAKYLDQLPALIAQAREQDRRCAGSWTGDMGPAEESRYRAEQDVLIELLQRFRFRPKLYEVLTRQPDKPLLRDALRFVRKGQETTPAARALEQTLRMRLREFVLLEEGLEEDFRDLDEARELLCAAHKGLALRIARSHPGRDKSTVSSALVGLRRAAAWYDYKRGYSFEAYAQHWVREAIKKRRQ
jgi:DNA-directed RNA polymerase sigma subunit (sigma70/sigma32)